MGFDLRIDSYSFGRIRVDGADHRHDLILLRGEARGPWWREAGGHVFAPVDLEQLIAARPEVVVLGTGYFGRVRVEPETNQRFEDNGCEVVAEKTAKAVLEFNRLSEEGVDVAAALHLTC